MTIHLRAVPTATREDQINALVRHMTADPAALRAVATEVVDGTDTLAAAGAEIVRLRELLGLPTPPPTPAGRTHADQPREGANQ